MIHCVDYKDLDKYIVKNKFSIPMIKDLLDKVGYLFNNRPKSKVASVKDESRRYTKSTFGKQFWNF